MNVEVFPDPLVIQSVVFNPHSYILCRRISPLVSLINNKHMVKLSGEDVLQITNTAGLHHVLHNYTLLDMNQLLKKGLKQATVLSLNQLSVVNKIHFVDYFRVASGIYDSHTSVSSWIPALVLHPVITNVGTLRTTTCYLTCTYVTDPMQLPLKLHLRHLK